jgi:hypothetical protein
MEISCASQEKSSRQEHCYFESVYCLFITYWMNLHYWLICKWLIIGTKQKIENVTNQPTLEHATRMRGSTTRLSEPAAAH